MFNLKQQNDLQYANLFIDWLNRSLGLDYKVYPNEEENSDTDVFAVSDSGKPQLNLQMVTSDGKTLKQASDSNWRMEKGLEIVAIDVDLVGRVSQAIEEKNRKYSKKEDLVLVIEGFMPTPRPEEIEATFVEYQQLDFKGIYYVSIPVVSSTNEDYEKNGYVVAIKKIRS